MYLMDIASEQAKMGIWDMSNRREEQQERWTQQHDALPVECPTNIYTLESKYYQKLGEGMTSQINIPCIGVIYVIIVWDHETKDFKVLYKPMYCCGSKKGSFEAHHLAVSTFERWERKFTPVHICRLEELPAHVRIHVVSSKSVLDLSSGNDSLPLASVPLPPQMQKSSSQISVTASEPTSAILSSGQTICRSDSGYGSRSLVPYYVLDFSLHFKDIIQQGKKRATTRVLKAGVEGGEPHLMELVRALDVQPSVGVVVQAVCDDDTSPALVFATLRVSSVEEVAFANLTQEIAEIEQFSTLDEFRACLRGFYPWIGDDDKVHVFYFELHTLE